MAGSPTQAVPPTDDEVGIADLAVLLQLADGRLPAGGHANGSGIEWASRHDDLSDPAVLERWIDGRLRTTGMVEAAFAVAATAAARQAEAKLMELDAELSARIVGDRVRTVSRQLGRQFQRAVCRIWPDHAPAAFARTRVPNGHHLSLATGLTCGVLGIEPVATATVTLHQTASSAVTAAVRLLGLDPIEAAAVQARSAATIAEIAADAPRWTVAEPAELPSPTSPLAELLAEDHGLWPSRLFVA